MSSTNSILTKIKVVQPKRVGELRSAKGARLFFGDTEVRGIKLLEAANIYSATIGTGSRLVIELCQDIQFVEGNAPEISLVDRDAG